MWIMILSHGLVFNQHILLHRYWSIYYEHLLTLLLYSSSLCCYLFLWWYVGSCWVETILCRLFYCLLVSVLPLEIQMSKVMGYDPINQFNPATIFCLCHARTWIVNDKCNVVISFVINDLRYAMVERFVDIGAIVDHHCLNFVFVTVIIQIINNSNKLSLV